MAHEVETMMYVGVTPWHEKGKKLDDAPDTRTAIVAAGLDWTVHAEPLYRKVLRANEPELQEVEAQCVVRDSDGKVLTHHVGPEWSPFQNVEKFNWFDPWVQSGTVKLESLANQQFEASAEQYRFLASRAVNKDDLKKYVRIITDTVDTKKEETKTEAKIIQLFEGGRGAGLATAKGTWWGAYNAVTEFLTWERGKTQDGRLDNLWLGQGKNLNRRALETALLLAA